MKVLVCGSRLFDLDDGQERVRARLDDLLRVHEFCLITGGANGPDEFARKWAVETEVDHHILYASWDRDGKRAGVLRNLRMLDERPELVIAFWDGDSRGTKHTIDEALRRGIRVEVVYNDARASSPDFKAVA